MTNLNSSIEWTDTTWSPTVGCTKVSAGCDNCYAEGIARRFAGSKAFPNGFDLTLHPHRLEDPLSWRKPRRVFVNSMSDLFHAQVSSAFLASVFDVMARTPRHTYQILTKRHARLRSVMRTAVPGEGWPLPNVHLGVSVENQHWADLRVPALLDVRAVVRFLSCEPLLGPIDLTPWLHGLQWVIVGGESGQGARRMEMDWAHGIVEQCQAAGVPVFVKQLGSAHGPHKGGDISTWPTELQVREYPAVAS